MERFARTELTPARAVAIVRLAVLAAIYIADRAETPIELRSDGFDVLLALAAVWALAMGALAVTSRRPQVGWPETAIDLLLAAGVVYASGGPFSDARRVFFVFPVIAAAIQTPRNTLLVGVASLIAFTGASLAEGFDSRAGTLASTLAGDVYLLVIVIATVLTAVLIDAQRRETGAEAERNRMLSRQVLEVRDDERRELAQWLHDEPVQLLVASRMELGAVRGGSDGAAERLSERIELAEASLREQAFELSPYALEELGLCEAIRLVAEGAYAEHAIDLRIDCEALPPHTSDRILFAIARELISNVVRHARASTLEIAVATEGKGVSLVVADDGIGLERERRQDALRERHLGLASAKERAATAGCTLRIERPSEGGTRVWVRPACGLLQ